MEVVESVKMLQNVRFGVEAKMRAGGDQESLASERAPTRHPITLASPPSLKMRQDRRTLIS